MKVSAHCFAKNAKINPLSINFSFRGFDVQVLCLGKQPDNTEGLTLKLTKNLSQDEIDEFRKKPSKVDDPETFFGNRSRKYEEALRETAHLVEGLLALLYGVAPPKFDTSMPIVNLIGDNEDEINLLNSDSIIRGFGIFDSPAKYPLYQITEEFKNYIDSASNHLPALSFLSQAKRSYSANDQEVAFFLYFRIIDGYFAYGAKDVVHELLSKETELQQYLLYENKLLDAVRRLLHELGLPSKSKEDFKGLIRDIVLIRHKLTHFSSRKSASHHSHRMIGDLAIINAYLDSLCTMKLQDDLKVK